jgi:hypothetical protein
MPSRIAGCSLFPYLERYRKPLTFKHMQHAFATRLLGWLLLQCLPGKPFRGINEKALREMVH